MSLNKRSTRRASSRSQTSSSPAGGTMNREAAALGTPVYTTFAGRLGGVDEELIRAGRLRRLERADDLELRKREATVESRVRRNPRLLLDLLLAV